MTTNTNDQKKRLRKYLNPAIAGANTDAVLEALASGPVHLINNVEAVNDSLYIVTASEQYLDAKLADKQLTRPENVGLSDDIFRKIGIEVSNRKQVRDLINNILEIIYGEEFTRATSSATILEPYQLIDGDTILLQFDDGEIVEIPFSSSQFGNINQATSQEIADVISRYLSNLGKKAYAVSQDDGNGAFVMLFSGAIGPSSAVKVLGGRAQNALKFPEIRPTSANAFTQWTIQYDGSSVKMVWSGGSYPSIGKVKKGDYVNIFGSGFNPLNRGTFTVISAVGGSLNNSYIEFQNPNAVPEIVVQGSTEGVLFFNPKKSTIISKYIYASVYQTEAKLIEVFIPATTRVVRRNRKGAAHLQNATASVDGQYGPYLYDETKPYTVGPNDCSLISEIQSNSSVISVDNSADFEDGRIELVFGFGTSLEEGPVSCIGRPSNGTLRINPSYKFKNKHKVGTLITQILENNPYTVSSDSSDFPTYLTDMVSGRDYSEELIKMVAATGIGLIFTIIYPNPIGLAHWNRTSEIAKEWQDVWS